MKQLTCEMCGSTDLIKEGGVFVCQSCGCKYSVEEAKKMMVEGAVEVTGTVKVDNSAAIDNYLKMAKNALDSQNNEEAENYANKIIELEPQHSEAWEIKGEAAGWQSKTLNNRLPEAVTAWVNAVEFAADEEKEELRGRIADKFENLYIAMTRLYAGNFETIQSESNLNSTLNCVNEGINMMNTLVVKAGVSFSRLFIYEELASILNQKAIGGYKDAKKDFGPEHHKMLDFQWRNFYGAGDNCITMLERASELVRSNSLGKTICENMIIIAEEVRDSKAWAFNVNSWNADHYDEDYSFTEEAKKLRTKKIDGFKEKKKLFEENQSDKLVESLQAGRKEEEIKLAKEKYWEEHAEEKKQLESEKESIKKKLDDIDKSLKELPIIEEIKEADEQIKSDERQIADLNKDFSNLGLFKGKEKKELREKIEKAREKLSEKNRNYEQLIERKASDEKPYLDEKESINKRIEEIDVEFKKNRGQVSVSGNYLMENAIIDGKFAITDEQFEEHMRKILPEPYKLEEKEDDGICMLYGENKRLINFCIEDKSKGDEDSGIPVCIFIDVEEETRIIKTIVIQGPYSKEANVMKTWSCIGSYVAMMFEPSLTQSEAESTFAEIALGYMGDSCYIEDEIRIELADYIVANLGLLTVRANSAVIRIA